MSYSLVSSHASMAFDEVRNTAYQRALHELVASDSVVLDLGAGIGILGLLAAHAGFKRVYLVEPEPVVRLANELARVNGVADRIIVLQGKIEDIELPEKVDLILSVFTGNLLYSEDLLPALFNARDRFLKPGGKLLPDQAELMLAPWTSATLHAAHVERWSQPSIGLNLHAGRQFAANDILWLEHDKATGSAMSAAAVISRVDLMIETTADCLGKAAVNVTVAGNCHGLMGWIRLKLGNSWLDTAPSSEALHWRNALLPVDPPLPLQAGEAVDLSLQRPAFGDWTWSLSARSGQRRHSTFLARPAGLQDYQQQSIHHQPLLGIAGAATLHILSLMDGIRTNEQLAESALVAFPQYFHQHTSALRFVQQLVTRYCLKTDNTPANKAQGK